jgi:hypothetical protein
VSYYLRAFCASDDIPPLRAVFEWAEARGVKLEAPSANLDAPGWKQAEIACGLDGQTFIAEADAGDLLREEVAEFVEFLEDVEESPERQALLDHLKRAKAVVAAQLPRDIDDNGYAAVQTFLTYFVKHRGALVQADGEGFYKSNLLIVELG